MEDYLKSLTIQLIDLEAQSPLMSNEKFRSEAISFLKGLLKIVNRLIPADKQSNFEGLKNLGVAKFTPSHDELLDWGFEPFKTSSISAGKKYFYDYYEKISSNKFIMQYYPYDNSLMEFGGKTKEYPFTTKEEFMSAVGVEEKRANVIKHETLYIPSEEVLKELGFNKVSDALCGYKYKSPKFELEDETYCTLFYYPSLMKFGEEVIYKLKGIIKYFHLRSDAELKMICEVLSREK